jgi:seryl-tRNA synthetase
MHNLKEIRKDFPGFEKALEKRSLKIDFKKLQKLDEENRNLIQKKRGHRKRKKRYFKI